jgi:hypothetical protein
MNFFGPFFWHFSFEGTLEEFLFETFFGHFVFEGTLERFHWNFLTLLFFEGTT